MSYSQDGQEQFVIEYLKGLRNGYFLDIGAYDGIEFSNTFMLETEYNWNGLLVECDPAVVSRLKQNRKQQIETSAMWSESDKEVQFKSIEMGKLSGIANRLNHPKASVRKGTIHTIKTISLNDLLRKYNCPKHINYMSLDVEGVEYDILSTFDFQYTFDVVSIEHANDAESITMLMENNGYQTAKVILKGGETIFVRKE